jgi:hypothetical protein
MTFEELLATGWTPPADDLHEDLFAPEHAEAVELRGSFADTNRTPGYGRGRGSYR